MQKPRKKQNRRWTVHDQVTAEVAAACGCSLNQVKDLFDTSAMQVLRRLDPRKAEEHRIRNRKWKELNKERTRLLSRQWKKSNTERNKEINRRHRACKYNAAANSSNPLTASQVTELKQFFGEACCYCGSEDNSTIDHVIPLSKGGSHELFNLLPACMKCNCSKHARPVKEWYFSKDFFDQRRWDRIVLFHPWLAEHRE